MNEPALANRAIPDLGPEIEHPVTLRSRSLLFGKKQSIFIHEHGFRLQQPHQTLEFAFSEIQSLAWNESDRYSNGICIGTKHDMFLKMRVGEIRLKHFSLTDSPDSFGAFTQRLLHQMGDAVGTQIRSGAILAGKDWVLSEKGLKTESIFCSWSEIADVEIVDGRVSVWRQRDSYPFFSVPARSIQARILLELLERYITQNPPKEESSGLGRYWFQRKKARPATLFLFWISILLLALGAWFLFLYPNALLAGFLFLCLGLSTGVYSIVMMRRVHDFYQNGIIQKPGHRVFLYKNCESLQYQVSLQYINGVYAFTRIRMRLKAIGTPDITIQTQCHGNDKEMEQAKLDISKRIADRLYLKVCLNQDVLWGKTVRISKDELHYLSSNLLWGKSRGSVSLADPISYSMDSGKFFLFRSGESRPLFEMDCDEENFYPGLFLLLRLIAEH